MSDILLTIKQVGEVEKRTERTIKSRIKSGYYKNVIYVASPSGGGKNGKQPQIALSCMIPSAQKEYAIKYGKDISSDILPALAPEATLAVKAQGGENAWNEDAMSTETIKDARVQRLAAIVQEAMEVPRGRKKHEWIVAVAKKHGTTHHTIYRHIKRYRQAGLAGLQHKKSNKGRARSWTQEALDWWIGLVLKQEHRKISKEALYKLLCAEAEKESWAIGSYESALWWLRKKVNQQLLALQRGGHRALDNSLPPVLRDYSDLAPFEILVGDQHKWDFWVVDDDTGEVFRPEGYYWQDLRTRNFYGGAVAKKYDSSLIGLALRMGIRIFGPCKAIYTDNGKPELSRYIMGVMQDMRTLGIGCERTVDLPFDDNTDSEEITPLVTMPGTHIKAIVRNAKAKMIEGTFSSVEGIMRNHLLLSGYCKRLTDSGEEQDIDQEEVEILAAAGKLPMFSEFTIRQYQALDHYNKEKKHRGVLKEWAWRPRPKDVTPMDCLQACYADGWRPRKLSQEAVDIIFLPKAARIVDRGRIRFKGQLYEHQTENPKDNWLVALHEEMITLRYDPMDPSWLLVFHKGEFCCIARPVEYSSMKDQELASRKIEEKRRLRKYYQDEYRRLTSAIPDFREYSQIPQIEKAAAQFKAQSSKLKAEEVELYRERTKEELDAEIAVLEGYEAKSREQRVNALPERPGYFISELSRYEWCVSYEMAGGTLKEEDTIFKVGYDSRMTDDQREYWAMVHKMGGV